MIAEIQIGAMFRMPQLGVDGILVYVHSPLDILKNEVGCNVPGHIDEQVSLFRDRQQRITRETGGCRSMVVNLASPSRKPEGLDGRAKQIAIHAVAEAARVAVGINAPFGAHLLDKEDFMAEFPETQSVLKPVPGGAG